MCLHFRNKMCGIFKLHPSSCIKVKLEGNCLIEIAKYATFNQKISFQYGNMLGLDLSIILRFPRYPQLHSNRVLFSSQPGISWLNHGMSGLDHLVCYT